MVGFRYGRVSVASVGGYVARLAAGHALAMWLFAAAGSPATARVLFSESFEGATPGGSYTGAIPGSLFGVASGTVDIIGTVGPSEYSVCPGATGNNCLDLNGTGPGSVISTQHFSLVAGRTYTLQFSASGSVADAASDPYAFTVSLGASGVSRYVVAAGSGFGARRFTYTPTSNEPDAALMLASATALPGAMQYGALIDNLVLSDDAQPGLQTAFTAVSFAETFDGATPGSNVTQDIPNTAFRVVSGNVDVFGNIANGGSTFYSCPSGRLLSNNCIDLNGTEPGAIATTLGGTLQAGTTYRVAFAMAENEADGTHTSYAFHVQLGNAAPVGFSVDAGSSFDTGSFLYTPTVDEVGPDLTFTSDSVTGDLRYGAFIDTVSVGVFVPEPSVTALFVGAIGLMMCLGRRRIL